MRTPRGQIWLRLDVLFVLWSDAHFREFRSLEPLVVGATGGSVGAEEMSRPCHRCGHGQHPSFGKKSASFGFGLDESSRDSFREPARPSM